MNNDDFAAQTIRLHVRQMLRRLKPYLHKIPAPGALPSLTSLLEGEREEHRAHGVLGRQSPVR
jgi:hypothetical protein